MRKKSSSPPQINFQKDNSLSIKPIRALGWQVGLIKRNDKQKMDNVSNSTAGNGQLGTSGALAPQERNFTNIK